MLFDVKEGKAGSHIRYIHTVFGVFDEIFFEVKHTILGRYDDVLVVY